MLHLKVLRSPHSHARIRRIDTSEAERHPGVAPDHSRRRRAAQSQHAAQPDQLRQGRRADAGGRQGALQGRADRRRRRRQPPRGVRGARQDPRRLRSAADRLRRRGGDEARRAGRQRDLSEEHVHLSRHLRPSEAALRRRRARLRRGRPRSRAALPDVADRACADRDQRLDRRARDQRPLRRLHLDAGAVLLARHLRQDSRRALEQAAFRRRHGRRRLRRQGRHGDRAACDPRRDADRAAGALRDRPRGGDAVLRRRAAPSASSSRTASSRDGRILARKLRCLLRQRRLYAPVELRRRQMRGASAGALHDPERLRRRLLRLHQPRAGDRDARLRRHRGRFRDRMPDGQARPSRRHGPDGVPHPQRLSRRRHEGAPARGEEHRADRMRAGRRREGEMAHRRGIQAHVVAQGRRRRARRAFPPTPRDCGRAAPAPAQQRTPTTGRRAAAARAAAAAAARRPPPPAPQPPRRTARRDFPRCSAGGADMAKLRGRGMASINYPDRHESRRRPEPGAGPFQSERQVHRRRCPRSISARA